MARSEARCPAAIASMTADGAYGGEPVYRAVAECQPDVDEPARHTGLPLNTGTSETIKVTGLLAIVLVVFLHVGNETPPLPAVGTSTAEWASLFIIHFIRDGLARAAVPLFFLISGYLFCNRFQPTRAFFQDAIKKRLKTVGWPYLIWSLLSFCLFFLFQLPEKTRILFHANLLRMFPSEIPITY